MNARQWLMLAALVLACAGTTVFLYNFAQFGDCRIADPSCETDRVRDGRVMLAVCAVASVFFVARQVRRWKGR